MTTEELLKLARYQIVDQRNSTALARDQLMLAMADKMERLRAALTISRGQWIHSVNARQCLEALGEPALDVARHDDTCPSLRSLGPEPCNCGAGDAGGSSG